MIKNAICRINYRILLSILLSTLLAGCGSDSSSTQINIAGTWNAYWYNELTTEDYLIIDENSESGNIVGRWYDAEDNVYYNATGTINDHVININVVYSFSWNMTGSLNADNNTITGNVTISGTSSFDGIHPIRFVKAN
ncbi:MAG: hypothetical protein OQK98_00700 [Gammaproteobacteria bacterium]|nr:hypothetical protein [Gammaproteobacteria bacterium]